MSLKNLPTKELLARWGNFLATNAANFKAIAPVYVELCERGVNFPGKDNPMMLFLPEVAVGKLKAEVLATYGYSPDVVKSIAELVPEDQEKLCQPHAKVAMVAMNGKVIKIPADALTAPQRAQVFGDGRIRTPDEQKPYVPKPPLNPVEILPSEDERILPEDFMTLAQKRQFIKAARAKGMAPGELAVDLFLRMKVITAPPPVRRSYRPSADNHAAM